MNRRTPQICAAFCAIAFALGAHSLSAQTAHTVVGSAAVHAVQGHIRLMGTVGQSAIGFVSASSAQASQGFWLPRSTASAATTGGMAEASLLSLTSAPNPLTRLTTLSFSVPERAHVSLVLFNAVGKQVRTILEEERDAGTVAQEADLSGLPSGTYTAILRVGERTASTTLLLVE